VDFNLTLIGQTIAMIVFVWFCMKFIWPPIMSAIEARQVEIADGLAAAERGQTDLENAKRRPRRSSVRRAIRRAASSIRRIHAPTASSRRRRPTARRERSAGSRAPRPRSRSRSTACAGRAAGAGGGDRDCRRREGAGREIDANAHRELLDQLASEL
jgi:F-type H+-transporting ATPase subunit b